MSPLNVLLLVAAGMLATASAAGTWDASKLAKTLTFDWNANIVPDAWSPVFADYNTAVAAEGMTAVVGAVPFGDNSTAPSKGYYFALSNRADDAYFGLKGYVNNLPKNKRFHLAFDIYIASNAGEGCFGAGGSPGESIYVKVGASTSEPRVSFQGSTWRFDNVNKGEQSMGGPAGSVAGNVAVPAGSCNGGGDKFYPKSFLKYKHVSAVTNKPYTVRTSKSGVLWLLAGFESGYEGKNMAYITKLVVYLYRAT